MQERSDGPVEFRIGNSADLNTTMKTPALNVRDIAARRDLRHRAKCLHFEKIGVDQDPVVSQNAVFVGHIIEKRPREIDPLAVIIAENHATAYHVRFVFGKIPDFQIEIGARVVDDLLEAFGKIERQVVSMNLFTAPVFPLKTVCRKEVMGKARRIITSLAIFIERADLNADRFLRY